MLITKSETHYIDEIVLEKILSSEKGNHTITLQDGDDNYKIETQNYKKALELYDSLDLYDINQAIERFQAFRSEDKYSKLLADLKQAEEKKEFVLMMNVVEDEECNPSTFFINYWDEDYWDFYGETISSIKEYINDFHKIISYKIVFWEDMINV